MPLRQASPLRICAYLPFAALLATARLHEARQASNSTVTLSLFTGLGPVSLNTLTSTSTSTTPETATMPSTSTSSERSPSPSSSVSSSSLTTASNTPATSSATPHPSASPAILNFTVHNMTACSSGLISWNYSGNEAELSLSITNISVGQNQTGQTAVNGTIRQQLVNTNTSASPWLWSSVNVTQGWYEIQGLALATPNVSNNSVPFFIANGTNVTCLKGTSSSASSSTSASAASKTNLAVIVGSVVGVIVGVALAITAAVCLWSRRRRKPRFVGGGERKSQKWGSLKSADSNVEPGETGVQLTGRRCHAHSESTAGVLEDVAGGKASTLTSPGNSDEDAVITGEEKPVSPASSFAMSPFDMLNTPVHYDRRASACYPIQIAIPVASESSRPRSASVQPSGQTIEQQAQRIRSSMEFSMQRRSERLSMPTLPSPGLSRLSHSPTHTQYQEEYHLSPVTATPINRSTSTIAIPMSRRRSRKPVPQYDPSVLLEDTNTDSVSSFTGGADSSHSNGTGIGTNVFGTPTDLVHKASFGDGRPVHYLIPDMPSPQQDGDL